MAPHEEMHLAQVGTETLSTLNEKFFLSTFAMLNVKKPNVNNKTKIF